MKKYRIWLDMSQGDIAGIFDIAADTYARWERGEQTPESPALVALSFESLLNRRLTAEANILKIKNFKDLREQTETYLEEIEKLQKVRVRHSGDSKL